MIALLLAICVIVLTRICMQKSSPKILRYTTTLTGCVLILGIGFMALPSASSFYLHLSQTPSYVIISALCITVVAVLAIPLLKKYPLALQNIYLRIPFITVLSEEIIFRAVLLGLLLHILPTFWGVSVAGIIFGLWHIFEPSDANLPLRQKTRRRLIDVIATSLAGVLFCLITIATETIVASFLLHWIINSAGILISLSQRVQNNLYKLY